MTPEQRLLNETRRHFFGRCGVGIGQIALAQLLSDGRLLAGPAASSSPMDPKPPHFPAKVKNVIYLFMAGGPSQLEMFDYKPKLQEYDGKPIPDSLVAGKRFAFMDAFAKEPLKVLGTKREFKRYGRSGAWVSNLLPNISTIVDDLAFISGISTDNFNHGPAKCFVNTGSTRFGRPSMGSWITYGIGSESHDLPGFVVLQSGPRGPRGGANLWSSGFLPTAYQGVPFRSGGDPILDLSNPDGVSDRTQRNTSRRASRSEPGTPEGRWRSRNFHPRRGIRDGLPHAKQRPGPDRFRKESKETLEMYGVEPGKSSYANNCLLARRLVERGTRFVQLYHTEWDHHDDLGKPLETSCREIDQPTTALIRDLKQRGLLDSTLVIWGGEFGRTPMGEVRTSGKVGRNHHIEAYTMFMAGAGIRTARL